MDSTGTVKNEYKYEPFGVASVANEQVPQPYQFHGGYREGVGTGFYKMGARYYDPEFGRFTQPEPAWSNSMFNTLGGRNLLVGRTYSTGAMVGQGALHMPGGYYPPGSEYNWYSYAGSDPINGKDVAGYWLNKLLGGAAIGVGIAMAAAGGAATIAGIVPGLAFGEVNLLVSIPVFTIGVAILDWGVQQNWEDWTGLPPVLSPPWW